MLSEATALADAGAGDGDGAAGTDEVEAGAEAVVRQMPKQMLRQMQAAARAARDLRGFDCSVPSEGNGHDRCVDGHDG